MTSQLCLTVFQLNTIDSIINPCLTKYIYVQYEFSNNDWIVKNLPFGHIGQFDVIIHNILKKPLV